MKSLLICLFPLFCMSLHAQELNLDNYQTLQAQGKIPADFSKLPEEKLEEEINSDSPKNSDQEEFLEMIHFGINDVLHSGRCVYGDPDI